MHKPSLPGIAMLGGTFNPIHNAHLFMAEAAYLAGGLEAVLLMVDRDPPHKRVEGEVTAAQRLAMARLAADGLPGIRVSELELRREGKSYTVDTLRALRARMPDTPLYCVVGGDMLSDLPSWRETETILRLAHILCVPRKNRGGDEPAVAAALRARYGARVTLLETPAPDISSTQIRERIAAGLPIEGLTPPAVEAYLYEEGLYLPPALASLMAALREGLSPGRYRHTMGVVRTAAALAARYGAEPQQARLAALLHDCGRAVDRGALTHAAASERLARACYGVRDAAVLRAIRLHTTGGPDMTLLDRVVYLADLIEPNRDYPGVAALRDLARQDLTAAVIAGMRQTVAYVRARGGEVDAATLAALEALTGECARA